MNKEAYSLMKESNKIAIFTHTTPDCDGVASSAALKLHLESLGKQVQLFCDDDIPQYLNLIPFCNAYQKSSTETFDMGIILDCVNVARIGKCANIFNKIKNTIVIDHHTEFKCFASVNISQHTASSTGEMLYDFFKENNINITPEIARCLYISIASDTNGFINANTTVKTFKTINDLILYDIDFTSINDLLFKVKTYPQIELLKTALNKVHYPTESVLICALTLQDFKACEATIADTIGIIALLSGINKVKVAILLSEKNENEFLLSIRTKGEIEANTLAKAYGGGGHLNASGCKIKGKLDHILPKLLTEIEKVMKNERNN